MRSLLLLFMCAGIAVAACSNTDFGNGFTCIQQNGVANGGVGATAVATLGSTTVAGRTVIVFGFACGDAPCTTDTTSRTLSVSNGAGDTATQVPGGPFLTSSAGTNGEKLTAWVFSNVSATTTFTVTCGGGNCYYVTTYASEWTGITNTSPFDATAATSFSASDVTSSSANAGTTTNAVDLILGFIELSAATNITPSGSATEIGETVSGIQHQAKSVAATGAQTCAWTFSSARHQSLCMALKGAGVASTVLKRKPVILQ